MDFMKFYNGEEPLFYNLMIDRSGDLIILVHPVLSCYFEYEGIREHFERVVEDDLPGLMAWKFRISSCQKGRGRDWTINHDKGYQICHAMSELFNMYLNYPTDEEWPQIVESGMQQKQFMTITPMASPSLPHSAYGIGGFISAPFLTWLQSKERQPMEPAVEAARKASALLLPTGHKHFMKISVIIGGEQGFVANLNPLSGACLSTNFQHHERLDSGNLHSAIDQIVGLYVLAAISDEYRREVSEVTS